MPSEHSFRRHFVLNGKPAARGGIFSRRAIFATIGFCFGCTNDDCIEIRFYRANLFPQYACLYFTGFASGLPLYFLINLIPAWLRSEQVDLKSIGLMALIGLPFT